MTALAGIGKRRSVIRALIEGLVISPAATEFASGMRFDPTRVGNPVWRG